MDMKKNYFVLLLLIAATLAGFAQQPGNGQTANRNAAGGKTSTAFGPLVTSGLTGRPDTSFNTHSAYLNLKRDHPEAAFVNEFHYSDVAEEHGINYCIVNNRKLVIDAFMPRDKSNKHRTAVIMIHGGGWRSGNPSQHHPLAQSLAHLGYVCFTPQYRLSTEALFPAGVYDIKAAIRWVRSNASRYGIDTAHIAVAGFSAGGELAAFMGVTGNMPLFEGAGCNEGAGSAANAVIDIDGILSFVHPEGGEGDDSRGISAATYWFGYGRKDNPGLWEAASTLSYVNSGAPPTLFINSAVSRMHAGRDDYRKVLEQKNIYTEVHEFENSPHSFCLFSPWFEPTVTYMDVFLQKVFH